MDTPLAVPFAFEPMGKIPRLNRDSVVTEKIDGTNASVKIYLKEDGSTGILAGSRSRWITPGKGTDNYGFAAWVEDNKAALIKQLGLGHHFGEWWGQGIQRGYGLKERRFSMFNTRLWGSGTGPPDAIVTAVPVIWEGPFSTGMAGSLLLELAQQGSRAAPGFMNPEGIVVYHKASGHLYKATCKDDQVAKSVHIINVEQSPTES